MDENIDFINSTKDTELKCFFCKEALFTEKDKDIIQEIIDGSKYFFILRNVLNCIRDLNTFMAKILKI